MALYDEIGDGYGSFRRPDPRIASVIMRALGELSPVVNIGAGTGSYEPLDRDLVAVEPSLKMIQQRSHSGSAVVRASAVRLPFRDDTFAAALAILTVHHWADRVRGLEELARVTRHRLVCVTWEPTFKGFWLVDDYFPEISNQKIWPTHEEFRRTVGHFDTRPLLIPHDCTDGFLGAYWRRPHAYLDKRVRGAMSTFAALSRIDVGLTRLRSDLADGTWERRNGHLMCQTELDVGYRLVTAELNSSVTP